MKEIFYKIEEDRLVITVDLDLYGLPSLFRTSYLFTDRCYLYLTKEGDRKIRVYFKAKDNTVPLEAIAGAFCNELIDQKVRHELALENGKIRELIVAQAFAEGNLLDEIREASDINDDPHQIAKPAC